MSERQRAVRGFGKDFGKEEPKVFWPVAPQRSLSSRGKVFPCCLKKFSVSLRRDERQMGLGGEPPPLPLPVPVGKGKLLEAKAKGRR